MRDKKEDIFNSAKELFSTKGFKDTNVSDITKMAGIGVGTFYNYYSSKEQLFLEIFLKESDKLKKSLVESVDLNDDPVTLVTTLVAKNTRLMNSNPILMEWFNGDVFSKLEKRYHEQASSGNWDDNLLKSFGEDLIKKWEPEGFLHSFGVEMIKKWKSERKIRDDIDEEMMIAFFKALAYIDIHRKEIGLSYYPQIIHYLAEFIMKGLTESQKGAICATQ